MNNKKYFIITMITVILHTYVVAAEYNSKKYENQIQNIVKQGNNDIKRIGAETQKNMAAASSDEEKRQMVMITFAQFQPIMQQHLAEISRTLQESDNEQRRCQQDKK